jgi:anti-sigma regulatory factor (Ser/Thr protein kinase)
MTAQLDLALLNKAEEIARAQDELERFAVVHQLPVRKLHEVQVALEEHLSNILHYSHAEPGDYTIQLQVRLAESELRIRVEDDGLPFNPLAHPVPDLSLPMEEKPIGGLGIHMIRNSLDEVEYCREKGKNILTMIKRM